MSRLIAVIGVVVTSIATSAGASIITHKVIVNPIQAKLSASSTSDFHVGNASRTLFEAETDKILAQAGVEVEWLDWQVSAGDGIHLLTSGAPDGDGFTGLGKIANAGDPGALFPLTDAAGRAADPSKRVVNMWFVTGLDSLGVASAGSGRIAIGNGVFAAHSTLPNDSIDTIAHEILHVIGGLPHVPDPNNVMAGGGVRNKPLTIDDITPDGLNLDILSASQITQIQSDPFNWLTAVPEPSSLAILGAGAMVIVRRRRA